MIGQIANLADSADTVETPLRRELNYFIKMISVVSVTVGIIFFILGFAMGYGIFFI